MNPFSMSNKLYEIVKQLVRMVLPAFSALYFGLAEMWGLPAPAKVVGTIALITTFLGVSMNISSNKYEGDGTMVVTEANGVTTHSLILNGDVDKLASKKQVTFKIAA